MDLKKPLTDIQPGLRKSAEPVNFTLGFRSSREGSMKFEVEHPDFKAQRIVVETPGIFRKARLFVNGSAAAKTKDNYLLQSDSGKEVPAIFKRNFFDPVPKLKIGDDTISVARPFSGLEKAWFVILILLIAVPTQSPPGSGLIAVFAAILSAWVFRSNYSFQAKSGLIVLVTAGAIAALVMIIVGITLITGSPPNKESIEVELQKASADINSKLPQTIDSETRLDSTLANNKTLLYNVTLTNLEASQISDKELRNAMEEKLVSNICGDKKMKAFILNSVTISFAYHDKNGKQISVISIAPSKCTNH